MFRIGYDRATGVLQRYTKCSRESYGRRSPTFRREVMESKSGRPRTEACTFLSEHVTGLLHCFTERLTCSGGVPPCYDHDIIFFTPSVKVKMCLLSLSSYVRQVYGQLRGHTGFLLRLRSTSQQGQMVYDHVLFSVWHARFFTQICNPQQIEVLYFVHIFFRFFVFSSAQERHNEKKREQQCQRTVVCYSSSTVRENMNLERERKR